MARLLPAETGQAPGTSCQQHGEQNIREFSHRFTDMAFR
jgi:hypothetical protein